MTRSLWTLALLQAASGAWAQTAAVATTPSSAQPAVTAPAATGSPTATSSSRLSTADEPVASDRPEPNVQHSVIEDQGAKIDELRVRGQTRYIVVTPKVGTGKSYQILVNTDGRLPFEGTGGVAGAAGKRVWNVLDF